MAWVDSEDDTALEDLCCSICLASFTEPITLPCGHSFCGSPCLVDLLAASPLAAGSSAMLDVRAVRCPLDGREMRVTPRELCVSFSLRTAVELATRQAEELAALRAQLVAAAQGAGGGFRPQPLAPLRTSPPAAHHLHHSEHLYRSQPQPQPSPSSSSFPHTHHIEPASSAAAGHLQPLATAFADVHVGGGNGGTAGPGSGWQRVTPVAAAGAPLWARAAAASTSSSPSAEAPPAAPTQPAMVEPLWSGDVEQDAAASVAAAAPRAASRSPPPEHQLVFAPFVPVTSASRSPATTAPTPKLSLSAAAAAAASGGAIPLQPIGSGRGAAPLPMASAASALSPVTPSASPPPFAVAAAREPSPPHAPQPPPQHQHQHQQQQQQQRPPQQQPPQRPASAPAPSHAPSKPAPAPAPVPTPTAAARASSSSSSSKPPPAASPASSPPHKEPGVWSCDQCTYDNGPDATECLVCLVGKRPAATAVAPPAGQARRPATAATAAAAAGARGRGGKGSVVDDDDEDAGWQEVAGSSKPARRGRDDHGGGDDRDRRAAALPTPPVLLQPPPPVPEPGTIVPGVQGMVIIVKTDGAKPHGFIGVTPLEEPRLFAQLRSSPNDAGSIRPYRVPDPHGTGVSSDMLLGCVAFQLGDLAGVDPPPRFAPDGSVPPSDPSRRFVRNLLYRRVRFDAFFSGRYQRFQAVDVRPVE